MTMAGSRTRLVAGGALVIVSALLVAWLLRGGNPESPRWEPPVPVPATEAAPIEEEPSPRAVERNPPAAPAVGPEEPVPEPVSETEGLDGIPMRLVVRDGTTGKVLTVRSMALVAGSGVARFPIGVESVPVPEVGEAHAFKASPFLAGGWGDYRVTAQWPDGYVVEHRKSPIVEGLISAFAERIEAEVLVWPEARVRLVAVEADGSVAKEAEVYWGEIAGKHVDVVADPTDFRGEAVVRGVPFLRGERIVLSATIDDRSAKSSPATLKDRVEEVLVRVTLPKEAAPLSLEIGAGTMFGGRDRKHKALRIGEKGSLRVKVLRTDGRVVPDVTVEVGSYSAVTGPDGVATLREVVIGEREAFVSEPGFHTNVGKVVVTAGREAQLELREASGQSAEVLVVDDEGKPVAGASLRVTTDGGVRYCLMEGGVQVVGIHTGPDGRRTLPGLPPGSAKVSALFGSRKAEGTVVPGVTVEIRLPAVK